MWQEYMFHEMGIWVLSFNKNSASTLIGLPNVFHYTIAV